MQSTESLASSSRDKGNDILKNVYNVNKTKMNMPLVRRQSVLSGVLSEKGYPIKNGKCGSCNMKLDLETIAEYQPEKKLLQKFESLMLGR